MRALFYCDPLLTSAPMADRRAKSVTAATRERKCFFVMAAIGVSRGTACLISSYPRDSPTFLGFHTFCLDPPLTTIPKDQWFCHICLFDTGGDYGFDEGEDHTLTTFKARDHAFRKAWFEAHPPKLTTDDPVVRKYKIGEVEISEDDVEREFWRLVESPLETVEVEYGADVHSTTHGRYVSGSSVTVGTF